MEHVTTDPIVLRPDRFTPLNRTPWAGSRIFSLFKNHIEAAQGHDQQRAIGESWEFSCDPTFPSLVSTTMTPLPELIRACPEQILSQSQLASKGAHCEILVKLLNASMPLSLQVHPSDGDKALDPHECGKPESWLVLDAEPGSGLYLGFSQTLTKHELRDAFTWATSEQADSLAKKYLQFVPVKKGDYFEIDPGVVHAIAPGVTLLEPQRIAAGKTGKTYRLWDWGRLYDQKGQVDMKNGNPRPLHMEEALRIIDIEGQVGPSFVDRLRRTPEVMKLSDGGRLLLYPENSYCQTSWLQGNFGSDLSFSVDHGYAVLVNLGSPLSLTGTGQRSIRIDRGYTALIPAESFPVRMHCYSDVSATILVPSGASLKLI